jgi:radical SAM/Cys-rich protein
MPSNELDVEAPVGERHAGIPNNKVLLTDVNLFEQALADNGINALSRPTPTTLQVNLGKRCNQACRHCHVDAGPTRTEAMSLRTMDRVLYVLERSPAIHTLDITGGAPELHPHFRHIVTEARALGRHVMDRCNLTVLSETGQEDTANFLATNQVEVVASLPCYSPDNVNKQRGTGVFAASIRGLQSLNALGYGNTDRGPKLNLVYNPLGASLPPEQAGLEEAYTERLQKDFGIQFNNLYTITNMPIARFKADLSRSGKLPVYMDLLREKFNPASVQHVMCRDLVSVSYDGGLYDCDFNQMLELPIGSAQQSIWDVESLDELSDANIVTADHCLGCTAGAGSSCGGALQ